MDASPESQKPRGSNPWMISTLLLLGVVAGYALSQLPAFEGRLPQAAVLQKNALGNKKIKPPPPTEEDTERVLSKEETAALADDDPFLGDGGAAITMVEFSDYQCPFCGRFAATVLPAIEEAYIKSGKVRFVYRDFPLDGHREAFPAAEAAGCAEEQGKFKEMHDALFVGQQEWSGNPDATKVFAQFAKQIGLDQKKFDVCFSGHTRADEIRKDTIAGMFAGVSATPTFFINGKPVSGALPFELFFKPILEAELAGKKWTMVKDAGGNPISVKVEAF